MAQWRVATRANRVSAPEKKKSVSSGTTDAVRAGKTVPANYFEHFDEWRVEILVISPVQMV